MTDLNGGINSFNEMEELLKELHMHALDCEFWNEDNILRYRQFRLRVDDTWKKMSERCIRNPYLERLKKFVAKARADIGDILFYDIGISKDAIVEYESALSCEPDNLQALKGIIAAYLQGSKIEPKKALPYAIRLAKIEPRYSNSVSYIESLIEKEY